MHKTRAEAVELAKGLVKSLKDGTHTYLIAPSFTALDAVSKIVSGSNIALGAQNMSTDEQGAHTGEVSVLQLKDLGVKTVILGHSERRHTYGETDDMINKKVQLALKHGLSVILCVGELLEEREAGNADAVCEAQIQAGLAGVSTADMARITIAYEPVWAIGTGKTATPQDADAMHITIRRRLETLYNADVAAHTVIQYGGSMKPQNAADLLAMPNIDGGLIGGAALNVETFTAIGLFDR